MRMKMCLPSMGNKTRMKKKWKLCQEPGCNKEFFDYAVAKYCPPHRDQNLRRRRRWKAGPDLVNQPVQARTPVTGDTIDMIYKCQLPGCRNEFRVKQFPGMAVIPRYCPDHRSEYKREHFTRMLQRKAA